MYRVTRKQVVRQKAESWEGECNCSAASEARIEYEDSCDFESLDAAELLKYRLCFVETQLGGRAITLNHVVFETPSFYRSVYVTIEEVK